MRIKAIQEKTASIASEIKNAYIDFSKMTVSVIAIETDVIRDGKPVVGYGFNSNGRYAQSGLLGDRFIPRLMKADPQSILNDSGNNLDPLKIWSILMQNEKPGGHGERSVAVGVIDMAVWDIAAKLAQKPLYRFLADSYGGIDPANETFVYAAGGYYYPGKGLEELKREMAGYLERGYRVVKMKIGGVPLNEDIQRIDTVCSLLAETGSDRPPGNRLAVDANGRFELEAALSYGSEIQSRELFWYEEAGDPLDYSLQAILCENYPHPMATGENLFSHQDVRNLLRYGGMRPDRDYLQMDPVLSYGLVEYMRMLEQLKIHGWSFNRCIPHGGHQFALHIAAGLGLGGNESYPEVFAPFGGFADNTPVENGLIKMTEVPGIGFEEKADLINLFYDLFGKP
ncbi:MAG: mandelate racemase/muconate lactonizing enzyme family protein [Desulfobacterales bacterium]